MLAFVDELAKIRGMKTSWRLLATALVGALLVSCHPSAPKFAFKHAERRGVLESNGMRFVIMPDETTQLVEVDVHYEVGEVLGRPGGQESAFRLGSAW